MAEGTIENITGRERRRRWSVAEKLRIVAESQEPGVRICDVVARHDVSSGLLHGWRRLARQGRLRSGDDIDFKPVRLAGIVNLTRDRRHCSNFTPAGTANGAKSLRPPARERKEVAQNCFDTG